MVAGYKSYRDSAEGFRVQEFGFGIWSVRCSFDSSGFLVDCSGFRVDSSGFRVDSSGFRVDGLGQRFKVKEGLGLRV